MESCIADTAAGIQGVGDRGSGIGRASSQSRNYVSAPGGQPLGRPPIGLVEDLQPVIDGVRLEIGDGRLEVVEALLQSAGHAGDEGINEVPNRVCVIRLAQSK